AGLEQGPDVLRLLPAEAARARRAGDQAATLGARPRSARIGTGTRAAHWRDSDGRRRGAARRHAADTRAGDLVGARAVLVVIDFRRLGAAAFARTTKQRRSRGTRAARCAST